MLCYNHLDLTVNVYESRFVYKVELNILFRTSTTKVYTSAKCVTRFVTWDIGKSAAETERSFASKRALRFMMALLIKVYRLYCGAGLTEHPLL